MFNNPVYNLPSQFNENLLPQNLAALSLGSAPAHHHPHHQQQRQQLDFAAIPFQQQQQQQQAPLEHGGYVPPSFNDPATGGIQWPAPDDTNVAYQRGSTVVRQYNNSMIDDYYKKFLRPITDYVAIPTNGQPTYVYQNLGGAAAASTIGGGTLCQIEERSLTELYIFFLSSRQCQSGSTGGSSCQCACQTGCSRREETQEKAQETLFET